MKHHNLRGFTRDLADLKRKVDDGSATDEEGRAFEAIVDILVDVLELDEGERLDGDADGDATDVQDGELVDAGMAYPLGSDEPSGGSVPVAVGRAVRPRLGTAEPTGKGLTNGRVPFPGSSVPQVKLGGKAHLTPEAIDELSRIQARARELMHGKK